MNDIGLRLFQQLKAIHPEISRSDYFNEKTHSWDTDELQQDLKTAQNKAQQSEQTDTTSINLDIDILRYVTNFLSFSEISESFKNVCKLFSIIGMQEMKKCDIYIINKHELQYQYEFDDNEQRYLCKKPENSLFFRVPLGMKTRRIFERYLNEFNQNEIDISQCAIYEIDTDSNKISIPTINCTKLMLNDTNTVQENINNKYMICQSMNETLNDDNDDNDDLLLFIQYFDIFEQHLYAKWLLVNKQIYIKRFIDFIASMLMTFKPNNFMEKLLIYKKCDDIYKPILINKNAKNERLESLNIEYLSTILFQINCNIIDDDNSGYLDIKQRYEKNGHFWYYEGSYYIECKNKCRAFYVEFKMDDSDLSMKDTSNISNVPEGMIINIDVNTTFGLLREYISDICSICDYKVAANHIEFAEFVYWNQTIPENWDSIYFYFVNADVRENDKKCKIYTINGHDLMGNDIDNKLNPLYVNVLDMGMRTLLNEERVYKDVTFKELYHKWSNQMNIPLKNLMIWNFTERKNKTFRPNREIILDLNEKYEKDENITDDMVKTHIIPTKAANKTAKSIYERIGNMLHKKRSFMVLDDRKVQMIGHQTIDDINNGLNQKTMEYHKTILVALKYFDIFEQKIYFVDWFKIKTLMNTFKDLANYIETILIPNTMNKRSYFKELSYMIDVDETDEIYENFEFFEEEAIILNKSCKVHKFHYDEEIYNDFYYGDIIVFQLNPEIYTIKRNELEIKNSFEQNGTFWYSLFDEFILSQINLINVEINPREYSWNNGGWNNHWNEALFLQNKERKKLSLNLKIEAKITYGMIRKKLGNHYNINPKYIEIWKPLNRLRSDSIKWDYGSKGRGEWNESIVPISSVRSTNNKWQKKQYLLRYEIVCYDITDFDQMISYQKSKDQSKDESNDESNDESKNENVLIPKFTARIKELAIFNFIIMAPNQGGPGSESIVMTILYTKDWKTMDIIQEMLKIAMNNTLFGYVYFAEIIKYIKKYEMNDDEDDDENEDIDLSIINNLEPNRFLIYDETDTSVPTEYFMNDDEYKMPDNFSQIKYTDFKIQFLTRNDPLVLQSNDRWKALWIYFKRSTFPQKTTGLIRCVIDKDQSLKDIIIGNIATYLKVRKSSEEEKKNDDDILFETIIEKHQFVLKGYNDGNVLKQEMLENNSIFDTLTDKMYLIVLVPKHNIVLVPELESF